MLHDSLILPLFDFNDIILYIYIAEIAAEELRLRIATIVDAPLELHATDEAEAVVELVARAPLMVGRARALEHPAYDAGHALQLRHGLECGLEKLHAARNLLHECLRHDLALRRQLALPLELLALAVVTGHRVYAITVAQVVVETPA